MIAPATIWPRVACAPTPFFSQVAFFPIISSPKSIIFATASKPAPFERDPDFGSCSVSGFGEVIGVNGRRSAHLTFRITGGRRWEAQLKAVRLPRSGACDCRATWHGAQREKAPMCHKYAYSNGTAHASSVGAVPRPWDVLEIETPDLSDYHYARAGQPTHMAARPRAAAFTGELGLAIRLSLSLEGEKQHAKGDQANA